MIKSIFLTICIAFLLCSCNSSNQVSLDVDEFIISDSLDVCLVAAEPKVILPVAIDQDMKGNLWLVEIPGYMRDIDANGEDIADGRIIVLSDNDGDGKMDKRHVFLDSLLNPRAIKLIYDGLLYTDGLALKWCTFLGKADAATPQNIEIVDSFYVIGGNIEHQPNGLFYGIDNWIYSAKSNVRYQRKNGIWIKDATTFRGQWGISSDQDGRLISNHNSIPLSSDISLPNRMIQNEFQDISTTVNQLLTKDFSLSPWQATAVNRGYQEGVLDSNGYVVNLTSACAPLLYYGPHLGEVFYGNAFVCAPEANQILEYEFIDNTFPSKVNRRQKSKAFLVSKEESFRPVNLFTGLDGYLYVVDMRKGIIQHTAYMTNYLREIIEKKKLDQINNLGRIYRIQSKNEAYSPLNLQPDNLVELLDDPNFTLRLFAQRKIISSANNSTIKEVHELLQNTTNEKAQIHCIWILHALDQLDINTIVKLGLNSESKALLQQILYVLKADNHDNDFQELYQKILEMEDPVLNFELAHNSGEHTNSLNIWKTLAERYSNNEMYAESLISGLENEEVYLSISKENWPQSILYKKLLATAQNRQNNRSQKPKILLKPKDDDRTNGLKIFSKTCATCHGINGKGIKNLAPSLTESDILKHETEKLVDMILNGYQVENSAYNLAMPAYKNNPNMSDQDIVDLISYLNSFVGQWSNLKKETVVRIRNKK